MGVFKDLSGQRFGRLVAISAAKDDEGRRFVWTCKCDCGNYVQVQTVSLTHGLKQSCGCLPREMLRQRNTTHGHSKDRLYKVWQGMCSRCYNPHHKSFTKYGGRGIGVCDEWRNDYMAFRSWAYSHGYDETAALQQCSLDRIDVNAGYSPENCRWANAITQANNTNIVRSFTYKGQTKTLTEWASNLGMPRACLYARIQHGWDLEKAFETPVRPLHKREKTE